MNESAFHFGAARLGADLVRRKTHTSHGVNIAVVFSFLSVHALVNEQAYLAVRKGAVTQQDVSNANNARGKPAVQKIQMLLMLVFQSELDLSSGSPGADLEHLATLRNALVHYDVRVKQGLGMTLQWLSQRTPPLFGDDAASEWPAGWPAYASPMLADWAVETASSVAYEIADLMTSPDEAEITRASFQTSSVATSVWVQDTRTGVMCVVSLSDGPTFTRRCEQ